MRGVALLEGGTRAALTINMDLRGSSVCARDMIQGRNNLKWIRPYAYPEFQS
jgi:hypothetical protein